jgi:hypothetical protein
MADNTTLSPGVGGDVNRSKDRSGVKTEVVGIDVGIGTGTEALLSTTNPMPVSNQAMLFTGQTLNVTAATPVTGAAIATSTASSASFIVKNTLAGTAWTGNPVVVFEQSDDGASWAPLEVATWWGTSVIGSITLTPNAANAEQIFQVSLVGIANIRVRVVTAQATNGMTIITTVSGAFVAPTINVQASQVDGGKTTYSAGVSGLSTTLAGDIWSMKGSATKTIRVTNVEVVCTTGAATNSRLTLTKRTGFTSGTAGTAPTIAPFDTFDPAATATSVTATAAGTAGTTVAIVGSTAWFTSAAGTVSWLKQWGNRPGKAVVLRGTGEALVLNNAVAIGTSGSWNIVVEWTEE